MIRNVCFAAVLAMGLNGACRADIFKCTDPAGHVTYTNQKSTDKGCVLLSKDQPVSTVPGARSAARQPSPSSFPRVDSDTQKKRDSDRRRILEEELVREEAALQGAKRDLAEGESKTEAWISPDAGGEQTGPGAVGNPLCAERTIQGKNGPRKVRQCGRNMAGYEEKVKELQEKVDLHQRNVEALRKEIANVR